MKFKPLNPSNEGTIKVSKLYKFIREAQDALEKAGDHEASLRFEILGDWLAEDYKPSNSFEFTTRALGL